MKQFAVFDIDGTLVRWQLYHAVVDRLAKIGALGSDTHERIHHARMKWKRRESDQDFKGYEQTLIELFEHSITKLNPDDFDTVVNQVITEYQDQTYTYTRGLIGTLKAKGYTLLAISGSQTELVEQIAKRYGFDDFVATDYERIVGAFTGKKFVASHDKKAVLKQLVSKHDLSYKGSYAVGDSKSDAAMLELVENPIAFNPDKELLGQAMRSGWKIVIERKDVVYELEQQNGTYLLV